MKCATIFVLLAAMLVAVSALPRHHDPPRMPRPSGNPHFGGYGSFNPRGRRSPVGKIGVDQPINGDPSVSAGYIEKVYENKHGSIVVFGEANKSPDKKVEGVAGVRGQFTWGGDQGLTAAQEARIAEINKVAEIDRIRKELKID